MSNEIECLTFDHNPIVDYGISVELNYPKELVLCIAQEMGGEEYTLRQLAPHLQHIECLELPFMLINEPKANELIKLKSLKCLKFYSRDGDCFTSDIVDILISCNIIEHIEMSELYEWDEELEELKITYDKKGFDVTGPYPTVIKRR